MKKFLLLILAVCLLFLASSCGKPPFVPDPAKAAGVIIVNGRPEAGEDGRICGELAEDRYTFPLDAAMVCYFDYDADTIMAGDQNLSSLSFAADADTKSVGAVGTAGYIPLEGKENTVYAYYLHFDGKDLFFEPDNAFAATVMNNEPAVVEGIDYRCRVTLEKTAPATFFTVSCRQGEKELSFETVRIAEMTDYMKYPVPEGTDNIEINSFDAESLFIGRRILTEGETGYTASYDIGGQFPGVRTMRLVWPEKTEE